MHNSPKSNNVLTICEYFNCKRNHEYYFLMHESLMPAVIISLFDTQNRKILYAVHKA
jgi:hypothetical protein